MHNFRTYQLALELNKKSQLVRLRAPYKNQFERAVLSIALNLAEGSAKQSNNDRRRFYEIAFGSIRETQAIVEILNLETLRPLTDQLAANCHCLCRSLRN
jgi:four helix bundle protein